MTLLSQIFRSPAFSIKLQLFHCNISPAFSPAISIQTPAFSRFFNQISRFLLLLGSGLECFPCSLEVGGYCLFTLALTMTTTPNTRMGGGAISRVAPCRQYTHLNCEHPLTFSPSFNYSCIPNCMARYKINNFKHVLPLPRLSSKQIQKILRNPPAY